MEYRLRWAWVADSHRSLGRRTQKSKRAMRRPLGWIGAVEAVGRYILRAVGVPLFVRREMPWCETWLDSLAVGSRLVGVERAIADLGPFFGKQRLVGIVTACAAFKGAGAIPEGDAFSMRTASPVAGLALVARSAELVGMIEGGASSCGECELIHVLALVAGLALKSAGRGVFEQDIAVCGAKAFGTIVAHLVIVAATARVSFEVRDPFMDKKVS